MIISKITVLILLSLTLFQTRPLPPEDNIDQVGNVVYLPIVAYYQPNQYQGAAWAGMGARQPLDAEILSIRVAHGWGTYPTSESVSKRTSDGILHIQHVWCDLYPPHDYLNGTNLLQRAQDNIPSTYTGPILFANEPDLKGSLTGGQCDRTPRQVAFLYLQLREMFPNAELIGPQVSHLDWDNNWAWLRAFYNEITNMGLPMPDKMGLHAYSQTNPDDMIQSALNLAANYYEQSPKIWITEYGSCNPNMMQAMTSYYRQSPHIEYYFVFTPRWWRDPQFATCLNLFTDMETYQLTPVGYGYLQGQE